MTNDFSKIPSESEFRDEMTVHPEEVFTAAEELDENDEMVDDDDPNENEPDESMDGDFDSAMASAGLGTDEDYEHDTPLGDEYGGE